MEDKRLSNGRIFVHERYLREWLLHSAQFQRQTILLPPEKEDAHNKELKQYTDISTEWDLCNTRRKKWPYRYVQPFDFWNLDLVFPKTDDRYMYKEECYRDMFSLGAVKITMGKNKTMFYLPHGRKAPSGWKLRPAVDEPKLQFPEPTRDGRKDSKPHIVHMTATSDDPSFMEYFISFLEHEFRMPRRKHSVQCTRELKDGNSTYDINLSFPAPDSAH